PSGSLRCSQHVDTGPAVRFSVPVIDFGLSTSTPTPRLGPTGVPQWSSPRNRRCFRYRWGSHLIKRVGSVVQTQRSDHAQSARTNHSAEHRLHNLKINMV